MVIGKIKVTGTRAYTTEALDIPQGIVGAEVAFDFSADWAGLTKNVVFVGAKDVEILDIQDSVYLPPEVVSTTNINVRVGVVGLDANRKLVIPTLWADLGTVKPATPVDMGYDPTLPIWAQLMGMIGDLRSLNTEDKSNLVAAVNEAMRNSDNKGPGGYYTPVVTQPTVNTMMISFIPSVAAMPAVEPVTITLPGSNSGQNVELDTTLTQEGKAADAKATGDKFAEFEQGMEKLLQDIFGNIHGIFPVTAVGGKASHSSTEIGEAFAANMLPVLVRMTDEDIFTIPLTRVSGSLTIFERSFIVAGKATILVVTIDDEKNCTVTYETQDDSGVDEEAVLSIYQNEVGDIRSYGDGNDWAAALAAAFQERRTVRIPDGSFIINGSVTIPDNCCLELSQGTVLTYTQTSGNCITLNRSASLKGNHATVFVPYGFTGHVINVDTSEHEALNDVPPWTMWDPQWKTGRYLTNLNICMPNGNGEHKSLDGSSFGTAVYISANRQGTGSNKSPFIWGLNFSGLRIAGPFEYGIRAYNYDDKTWNHEMHIEAFLDACKVGVSLENCHKSYITATIQPREASDGTVYATHGIQLIGSKDTDLTGTRVWDWGTDKTLWTYDKSNVNQHIALYGDCRGTILSDSTYYSLPDGFKDIRELIYTDTPANFDSLVILQEPITRWFKPRENTPYFYDGDRERQLCLYEDLQGHFQTDRVPLFSDKLATAVGKDGAVLNGIGYIRNGTVWDTAGNLIANAYNGCTGLIPCKQGDVIQADGLSFANGDDVSRVLFFDANFGYLQHVNRANLIGGGSYYAGYEETENGFRVTLLKGLSQAAYAAFNFKTVNFGSKPVIAVNEEIQFSYSGFLAEGIKVKAGSVEGLDAAIEAKLGVIENGTY